MVIPSNVTPDTNEVTNATVTAATQNVVEVNEALVDLVDEETDDMEDVVIIEDEETALASEIEADTSETDEAESSEVIAIEDEETPLAAGGHCWIHWLILILTFIYVVFELIRSISRNKKINELKEELEEENATV